MRRVFQQAIALARRFRHELEFTIFEVAQTAMRHARRGSARALAEIRAVDEECGHAIQRELPHDRHAIDSTANDQDVKHRSGRDTRQALLPNFHSRSNSPMTPALSFGRINWIDKSLDFLFLSIGIYFCKIYARSQ